MSSIVALLQPHIDEAVIKEFRRRPPKYVVGEDLTWLDNIAKSWRSGLEGRVRAAMPPLGRS